MVTRIATAVRRLLQRRRVAREMDDELAFHIEMETQANIKRGLSPAEARRQALRDLGGMDQTKEQIRDVRTMRLDSVWQDVRHAVRDLRVRPAATVTSAAMLGLGIGITTAMFTMVDALILRPVPFHNAGELAWAYMGNERGGRTTVTPAVLGAWQASRAFAAAESAVPDTALVDVNGAIVARGMARVTPGLFDLLGGVRPIHGRLFDPSEVRAGINDRVLLSEDIWRTLYQADPAILGRRILVDGEPLVVIGVLPADFRFPSWNTVLWRAVDFRAMPASVMGERPRAYVRFSPNVPRADAARIATDAARAADSGNAELALRVQPLAGPVYFQDYYEQAVPLLAGAVILVFLVLCGNVSSLLLARLTIRQREFSMRSALGASRGRLIQQAFVESSVLGVLGVLAGIAIAWMLVTLSRAFLPEAFLVRTLNPVNIDARALGVTSVSGIFATLAASLLPVWIGTRTDADRSLRLTERSGTETRGARAASRTLLVGEIALACTLLVGATLLVRSFINLATAGRGLDADGVVVASLSLAPPAFPDRVSRATAARAIEERVRQLPGVQRVAWSFGLPPDGGSFSFGDWQSDAPGHPPVDLTVDRYNVGSDFFELYGIPLLAGRTFSASDSQGAVVVGERLARTLWPGLDPIGRTFSFEKERFQVIGLVREINLPAIDARLDRPEFYEPFGGVGSYAMMSIRCGAACPNTAVVRQHVLATHPAVRVVNVQALEDSYFEQLALPRATAALGFAFAGVAILAAAGGLFSVLSYAVGRRRREFGIRAALGASPNQVRRVVLRDGLMVAAAGVAIGSVAAWSLGRLLVSVQYGVTIADPLTWTVVLGVLGFTTLSASWRPARQATRADPVLLLREE
ncbi:MAG TPA: ABC transporter permease [Vicinamibacterales bacterium]|nr:ABC transporter permease [Vicinamibacterales bacterium]